MAIFLRHNSISVFLELLKAGLWEKDIRLAGFDDVDYYEILTLAEEQSVVGLVTAGLEHIIDYKIPINTLSPFISDVLCIEQRNKEMNLFLKELVPSLQSDGVRCALVKGQGIAQCYERPLWRVSGDIDFIVDSENYEKSKNYFFKHSLEGKEDPLEKHWEIIINKMEIEIHGTMHNSFFPSVNRVLDSIQDDTIKNYSIRKWNNNGVEIPIPSVDNDIIFVFTHILKHFFHEGVGLRQVCDLSRLLWTYRDVVDRIKLETRLRKMGVMTEWYAFAYLMVNYLGMPEDAMPYYSGTIKWKRKAKKILSFILDTGNFGHNRDNSYYSKYPYLVVKIISLTRHFSDYIRYFFIFPIDSAIVTIRSLQVGFSALKQAR